MVDREEGYRLIDLREKIVSNFGMNDWETVGLLTGQSERITGHNRLLRSLDWGDEDYSGNVLAVLRNILWDDPSAITEIEHYVARTYPGETHFVSAKPKTRVITFAPDVFEVPEVALEPDLVAVMMPFAAEFDPIYKAIKSSCGDAGLRSLRADDIWEESTIIQDIFNLLLRARIVVVDFSGRNENVLYETGIAHTLGKLVVPIAQSLSDVPFDLKHHRVLKYLPNSQGLTDLRDKMTRKLRSAAT